MTAIAGALDGYAEGDSIDQAVIRENAAAFASLLKHHIHLEDHVFFPLAREAMNAEEMEALGREFEREKERHGADTFQRFHKLVLDLDAMLAGE